MSATPLMRSAGSEEGRRVAVLGAGVAGLTAAQELAERGFAVTVYERRGAAGGKARSIFAPLTGRGGRRDLPGEHGHRMVLGFYRNLPDTLRRIPRPGGGTVCDALTPVPRFELARDDGRPSIPIPIGPGDLDLDLAQPVRADANHLVSVLGELLAQTPILPPAELLFLAGKVSMLFGSCDERQFGQWEHENWWEFIRAERMSEDYRRIWGGGVQILEALRARTASVRTIGQGLQAIFFGLFGLSGEGCSFDRVFNAPTSEAWIDPWVAHLRSLGVRFVFGGEVGSLEVRDGLITAARVRTPDGATADGATARVEADWFVAAVPADRAVRLWNSALRAADPRLAGMDGLRQTWSSGIQYFLRRPVQAAPGHVFHMDAPWKLASVAQSRFWDAPFAETWGDGRARESLSVVVSDWDTPGMLYGKPARACTRDEVAREVWAQMRAHLNKNEDIVLDDSAVQSWHLDDAIVENGDGPHGGGLRNDDPFLMNSVGSWDLRPDAATAVPNLFLAADYVRTYSNIDFATMETANEAARRAVNALLKAANAVERWPPVATFSGYESPQFAHAKAVDRERWRQGLPHVLDTSGD